MINGLSRRVGGMLQRRRLKGLDQQQEASRDFETPFHLRGSDLKQGKCGERAVIVGFPDTESSILQPPEQTPVFCAFVTD